MDNETEGNTKRGKLDAIRTALILVAVSMALVVLFVKGMDALLGWVVIPRLNYQWLVFEPGIEIRYKSTEFDVISKVNQLGFRDREFTINKTSKYRILALGDSFTYGWGVSIEESWPKRLEALFHENGLDVEVLNLGRPGGSPYIFSEIAKNAIPLLKPDLVVTAILQGEDLAACYPGSGPRTPAELEMKDKSRLVSAIRKIFPNILQLNDWKFRRPYKLLDDEIVEMNKGAARDFKNSMILEEKERYDKLDDEIKTLFSNGMLNPFIVIATVKYPGTLTPVMTEGPDLDSRIDVLHGFLKTIQDCARQNDAFVLVVSVPFPCFMTEENRNQTSRIGYKTTPEMCGSPLPDLAVKKAAESLHQSFCEVSESFRNECEKRQLFYPLDLHLNEEGHKEYSELIFPIVKEKLLDE